jgi:hypothetical protein
MAKKLADINMFFAGNPKAPIPERIFFTYSVVSGRAKKTNQVYEVVDFEPTNRISDFWDKIIEKIQKKEGIK